MMYNYNNRNYHHGTNQLYGNTGTMRMNTGLYGGNVPYNRGGGGGYYGREVGPTYRSGSYSTMDRGGYGGYGGQYYGGSYNEPYNRLYNDPYLQNPDYQQYGNMTFGDNSLRYRSSYNRMDGYDHRSSSSSSNSDGNTIRQHHTPRQELRRIRYLLVLLGIGTGFLYMIWRRWLRAYWTRFVTRWFLGNRQRNAELLSEDDVIDMEESSSSSSPLSKSERMIAEYDEFLRRQKQIKLKDSLQEKEIDDLLNLIDQQYKERVQLKSDKKQNEKKNENRSELIEKLSRGIKIYQQKQKDSVSYLRKIDRMSESELQEEFKKQFESPPQPSDKTASEGDEVRFTGSPYTKLIQEYLSRTRQKQKTTTDTSARGPLSKGDARNIVQEHIENEEFIVNKCQQILNSLYTDVDEERSQREQEVAKALTGSQQLTELQGNEQTQNHSSSQLESSNDNHMESIPQINHD